MSPLSLSSYSPLSSCISPRSSSSFCWRMRSCIVRIGRFVLLFCDPRSPIMSSRYITKIRALMAGHWVTPMLFSFNSPYLHLYFGASRPPYMSSSDMSDHFSQYPFLYSVAHRRVLSIAPIAFGGPISIILALSPLCYIYIVRLLLLRL